MPPLDNTGELETEFKTLGTKLKSVTDETRQFAESAAKEIKAFGKLNDETKARADEALTKLGETNSRLVEIEQRLSRRGGGDGEPEMKSLGDLVAEAAEIKAMNSGTRGSRSIKIEMKDITSATSTVGSTPATGNSLVRGDRVNGMLMLPERRLTVRDLISPGSTDSSAIEYVAEISFVNNAAPVAETTLKPKSELTFDLRNAPVRTLAHFMKASRQILDDAAQLRSVIDQRLRYGLRLVEEAQILSGAGTGANLYGIIPQATAYVAPITIASPTMLDQLRLMMLQASLALYPATGIVLNEADWARAELEKDTTGQYLIGRPQGVIPPSLWGLPVVATPAMTVDKALVGAFKAGAQLFDRMAIEVLISTENEDDFVKNMVTIRGEERLALAVYRPASFIFGDLGFSV